MRTGVVIACFAALVGADARVFAQADPLPELSKGIQQVMAGELEAGIASLEAAVRRLDASAPGDKVAVAVQRAQRARAHLFLGVAHLGLGRDVRARTSFKAALEADRNLTLTTAAFSPKVLAAFDDVRRELGLPMSAELVAGKRSGGKALMFVGAAAAVAGGTMLALGLRNRPPTVGALTIGPAGTLIAGVHTAVLTVQASDPDGDTLQFSWDFGDGTTSPPSAFSSATHTYATAGTFRVIATVTDGSHTLTATGEVTARTLDGVWTDGAGGDVAISQSGTSFYGLPASATGYTIAGYLTVTGNSPRRFNISVRRASGPLFTAGTSNVIQWSYFGDLDSALNTMPGTSGSTTVGGVPVMPTLTLTRR